uniref:Uncharacterized protein n=1 Tax=Rhizophora mucronata TaxID=61149 RepID=A0A2P2P7E0_RHIMU
MLSKAMLSKTQNFHFLYKIKQNTNTLVYGIKNMKILMNKLETNTCAGIGAFHHWPGKPKMSKSCIILQSDIGYILNLQF